MISPSKIEWDDGYGDVKTVTVTREYRSLKFTIVLKDNNEHACFQLGYGDVRAILELFKDPDKS